MGQARDHGRAGEAIAAAYLELLGWEVVQRNARVGGVEVDLVALEGRIEVLVEVKYRGRADFGGAALAVDHGKRDRLRRAALAREAAGARWVRVDVIAIDLADDGLRVRHYRNAVQS
jgi:putative endonuclease